MSSGIMARHRFLLQHKFALTVIFLSAVHQCLPEVAAAPTYSAHANSEQPLMYGQKSTIVVSFLSNIASEVQEVSLDFGSSAFLNASETVSVTFGNSFSMNTSQSAENGTTWHSLDCNFVDGYAFPVSEFKCLQSATAAMNHTWVVPGVVPAAGNPETSAILSVRISDSWFSFQVMAGSPGVPTLSGCSSSVSWTGDSAVQIGVGIDCIDRLLADQVTVVLEFIHNSQWGFREVLFSNATVVPEDMTTTSMVQPGIVAFTPSSLPMTSTVFGVLPCNADACIARVKLVNKQSGPHVTARILRNLPAFSAMSVQFSSGIKASSAQAQLHIEQRDEGLILKLGSSIPFPSQGSLLARFFPPISTFDSGHPVSLSGSCEDWHPSLQQSSSVVEGMHGRILSVSAISLVQRRAISAQFAAPSAISDCSVTIMGLFAPSGTTISANLSSFTFSLDAAAIWRGGSDSMQSIGVEFAKAHVLPSVMNVDTRLLVMLSFSLPLAASQYLQIKLPDRCESVCDHGSAQLRKDSLVANAGSMSMPVSCDVHGMNVSFPATVPSNIPIHIFGGVRCKQSTPVFAWSLLNSEAHNTVKNGTLSLSESLTSYVQPSLQISSNETKSGQPARLEICHADSPSFASSVSNASIQIYLDSLICKHPSLALRLVQPSVELPIASKFKDRLLSSSPLPISELQASDGCFVLDGCSLPSPGTIVQPVFSLITQDDSSLSSYGEIRAQSIGRLSLTQVTPESHLMSRQFLEFEATVDFSTCEIPSNASLVLSFQGEELLSTMSSLHVDNHLLTNTLHGFPLSPGQQSASIKLSNATVAKASTVFVVGEVFHFGQLLCTGNLTFSGVKNSDVENVTLLATSTNSAVGAKSTTWLSFSSPRVLMAGDIVSLFFPTSMDTNGFPHAPVIFGTTFSIQSIGHHASGSDVILALTEPLILQNQIINIQIQGTVWGYDVVSNISVSVTDRSGYQILTMTSYSPNVYPNAAVEFSHIELSPAFPITPSSLEISLPVLAALPSKFLISAKFNVSQTVVLANSSFECAGISLQSVGSGQYLATINSDHPEHGSRFVSFLSCTYSTLVARSSGSLATSLDLTIQDLQNRTWLSARSNQQLAILIRTTPLPHEAVHAIVSDSDCSHSLRYSNSLPAAPAGLTISMSVSGTNVSLVQGQSFAFATPITGARQNLTAKQIGSTSAAQFALLPSTDFGPHRVDIVLGDVVVDKPTYGQPLSVTISLAVSGRILYQTTSSISFCAPPAPSFVQAEASESETGKVSFQIRPHPTSWPNVTSFLVAAWSVVQDTPIRLQTISLDSLSGVMRGLPEFSQVVLRASSSLHGKGEMFGDSSNTIKVAGVPAAPGTVDGLAFSPTALTIEARWKASSARHYIFSVFRQNSLPSKPQDFVAHVTVSATESTNWEFSVSAGVYTVSVIGMNKMGNSTATAFVVNVVNTTKMTWSSPTQSSFNASIGEHFQVVFSAEHDKSQTAALMPKSLPPGAIVSCSLPSQCEVSLDILIGHAGSHKICFSLQVNGGIAGMNGQSSNERCVDVLVKPVSAVWHQSLELPSVLSPLCDTFARAIVFSPIDSNLSFSMSAAALHSSSGKSVSLGELNIMVTRKTANISFIEHTVSVHTIAGLQSSGGSFQVCLHAHAADGSAIASSCSQVSVTLCKACVRKGASIKSLALRAGIPWQAIWAVSPHIYDPFNVNEGEIVSLGIAHHLKVHQQTHPTLFSIAKKFNANEMEMAILNPTQELHQPVSQSIVCIPIGLCTRNCKPGSLCKS